MRAALLVLATLALSATAGAWHVNVVLLDAVAPAGELVRLEYAPQEAIGSGRLHVECPAGAWLTWQQSNVTEDAGWNCVGSTTWELPWMGQGAGYAVTILAASDARVLVTGDPGYRYSPVTDFRPYVFEWAQEGPDFHVHPLMIGSFRPATAYTDVTFTLDANGIQAEIYEAETLREVARVSAWGTVEVEDLVAGREYLVRMSVLGTCQPECYAPTDVYVRGWPTP